MLGWVNSRDHYPANEFNNPSSADGHRRRYFTGVGAWRSSAFESSSGAMDAAATLKTRFWNRLGGSRCNPCVLAADRDMACYRYSAHAMLLSWM
jgi:hypothetical protein